MKNFLCSILLLCFCYAGIHQQAHASPPDDEAFSFTLRTFPSLDANADTMGLAIIDGVAGLYSPGAKIFLLKVNGESGVNHVAIIGSVEIPDNPKGIRVSGDGELTFINSDKIVIVRKTFNSHAEADEALYTGEEYYLTGDRSVYRKP